VYVQVSKHLFSVNETRRISSLANIFPFDEKIRTHLRCLFDDDRYLSDYQDYLESDPT
jgi:hypothetical protein